MRIGEKIKTERKRVGWTQEELANELKVSRATVSSWEVGRHYPDIGMVFLVSELFDVSLDELLRGEDQMIENMAEDMKQGNKRKKTIHYLVVLLSLMLVLLLFMSYIKLDNKDIRFSKEIKGIEVTDKGIIIDLDVPFYRKASAYMVNGPTEDGIYEVQLGTRIDWQVTHKKDIYIPREDEFYGLMKQLNVISPKGEVLESIRLK